MELNEKRNVLKTVMRTVAAVNDYQIDSALEAVDAALASWRADRARGERKQRKGHDRQESGGLDRSEG